MFFVIKMIGPKIGYPGPDGSFVISPATQTLDYKVVAKTPAITTKFQAEIRE